MPGPSNGRKKRKSRGKEQKKKKTVSSFQPSLDASIDSNHDTFNSSDSSSSPPVHAPISHVRDEQSIHPVSFQAVEQAHDIYEPPLACTEDDYSHILLQKPFIYNPGNGPRVTNMRGFLASRFFSQPPALENPLCAEFAQDAVLEMIKTVLPEELALILWYNKSRATSRICPACQRLYHVADVLPDNAELTKNMGPSKPLHPPPELEREQELSGLCSSMCFILASFNQCDPRTTKAAWGHTAEEIDDASWAILNGASSLLVSDQDAANALVMLVRMTRLDDLGLTQLCFPDMNWEDQ